MRIFSALIMLLYAVLGAAAARPSAAEVRSALFLQIQNATNASNASAPAAAVPATPSPELVAAWAAAGEAKEKAANATARANFAVLEASAAMAAILKASQAAPSILKVTQNSIERQKAAKRILSHMSPPVLSDEPPQPPR